MMPWQSGPVSAKQTPPQPQHPPPKCQGDATGKSLPASYNQTGLQVSNETLIVKKRQNSYSLETTVKLGVASECCCSHQLLVTFFFSLKMLAHGRELRLTRKRWEGY